MLCTYLGPKFCVCFQLICLNADILLHGLTSPFYFCIKVGGS